ncbi:MAG: hypothetical protein QQN55_08785, partial [Nitrosopumilus sp.]
RLGSGDGIMAKIRYIVEIFSYVWVDKCSDKSISHSQALIKAQDISDKIPEDSFVGGVKPLPHGSENILRKEVINE